MYNNTEEDRERLLNSEKFNKQWMQKKVKIKNLKFLINVTLQRHTHFFCN